MQGEKGKCDYVASRGERGQAVGQGAEGGEPKIYLGGSAALNLAEISLRGIQAVLTVMSDKQLRKAKVGKKIEELDDINRHITILCHEDSEVITPYFLSACDFINDSLRYGFNILVHCTDGNNRAPALVAAYLVKECGLTFQQAETHIKSRRPSVNIGQLFREQLQEFAEPKGTQENEKIETEEKMVAGEGKKEQERSETVEAGSEIALSEVQVQLEKVELESLQQERAESSRAILSDPI